MQVGEIHAIVFVECSLVSPVSPSDGLKEWVGRASQLTDVHQLFGDLVKVVARAFDRSPFGFPAMQKTVVFRRPDNLVEVLENKEQLRQFIEGFVIISER